MITTFFLFWPIIVSFFVTLMLLPGWIRRAHETGLEGKDMNKYHKPLVAEGGGVTVIAGFVVGALIYVALQTFQFNNSKISSLIFASLTSVLMISMIGLVDNIFGWKKGLSKKIRLVLALFAAIPLVVIDAGSSVIDLPLLGLVNLGILYPLVIIPLGLVGASTTFNFLAGYNGLEARQGILILLALAIAAYFTGSGWLTIVLLCMVSALLAFLLFNTYPAKVFPGDVLTYSVGALIACAAVLGNLERFALFIFIPNLLEIILKIRGGLRKESFAQPKEDGSLTMPYPAIYGLEHLALRIAIKLKKKANEKDVVNLINLFQIVIIILAFFIFRSGLFVS